MAIGRLSMKVGKAGKAGPHAAYITREGQYANRLDKGERLEATEVGNMPAWAADQPQAFWQAADAFERSNGTTYREMEIALPRELDAAQRVELVKDWVRQEIGDRHAYQWAIHVPLALDGKDQPHVHLMFSERQVDGIERDPEQYFKRYNGKSPEKGGARKEYGQVDPTLKGAERQKARAADLKGLRGRWEEACNHALEQAGVDARIDMRSHAERGLEQVPEGKMLPSEWRAHVIEFRAAQANLSKVVPDIPGELVNLQDERERRAKASPPAQQPDPLDFFRDGLDKARAAGDGMGMQVAARRLELAEEAQANGQNPKHIYRQIDTQAQADVIAGLGKADDVHKATAHKAMGSEGKDHGEEVAERDKAKERKQDALWAGMTSGQLLGEIDRLRPPSVREAVDRDSDVQRANRDANALRERVAEAKRVESLAQQRTEEWREAHPLRAKLRDMGWKWEPLEKLAATEEKNRKQWQRLEPEAVRAAEHAKQVQADVWTRIEREQAPIRAQVKALEKLRTEKSGLERAEREAQKRERQALQKGKPGLGKGKGHGL